MAGRQMESTEIAVREIEPSDHDWIRAAGANPKQYQNPEEI